MDCEVCDAHVCSGKHNKSEMRIGCAGPIPVELLRWKFADAAQAKRAPDAHANTSTFDEAHARANEQASFEADVRVDVAADAEADRRADKI